MCVAKYSVQSTEPVLPKRLQNMRLIYLNQQNMLFNI